MAGQVTERRWLSRTENLAVNGASNGLITVGNAAGFYVKQRIVIRSATIDSTSYEIKRVVSPTSFYVGPEGTSIDQRSDVSQFLIAEGAQVFAAEQQRPGIDYEHILRHVYAEEPATALRVVEVNEFGEPKRMQLSNPLITEPFDYIGAAYPAATTEVYTYRQGGAAGTIVGVVTVIYVDATKENVLSVTRT